MVKIKLFTLKFDLEDGSVTYMKDGRGQIDLRHDDKLLKKACKKLREIKLNIGFTKDEGVFVTDINYFSDVIGRDNINKVNNVSVTQLQ